MPDTLHDIDFMVRDSKRFANTGNWGWAQFNYDSASDTFKPEGTGADCGYSCHTIMKAKDFVFTAYGKSERTTKILHAVIGGEAPANSWTNTIGAASAGF